MKMQGKSFVIFQNLGWENHVFLLVLSLNYLMDKKNASLLLQLYSKE